MRLLLNWKDLESRTVLRIRSEEAFDPAVERRKALTPSDRQIEERRIRNLSVAQQPLADLAIHLMEGMLEGPEFMFRRQHIDSRMLTASEPATAVLTTAGCVESRTNPICVTVHVAQPRLR